MKKLRLSHIYETTGDFMYDIEALSLNFEGINSLTQWFDTPYEDDYIVSYHSGSYENGEFTYGSIEELDSLLLENYRAIEKYIDLPDALPEISFSLVDEDEVWEEEISLRDFLKKYIFHYNILKDAKKAQKKYIAELE
ncbi:MAG: hypothetical protein Q4E36_02100 [Bacillota bacterium]|nr:hypothetical protein [Bacillota bacterium]